MMSVGARVARRMTLVLIGVAIDVGLSLLVSRALASLLLGRPVMLVSRRRVELDLLAREIQDSGGRAEVVVADLATPNGIETVVAAAARIGGIGVLVNNAGFGTFGPLLAHAPERDLNEVALNVGAVVALTRALLPEYDRARPRPDRERGLNALVHANTVLRCLRSHESVRPPLHRSARRRIARVGRARTCRLSRCHQYRVLRGRRLVNRQTTSAAINSLRRWRTPRSTRPTPPGRFASSAHSRSCSYSRRASRHGR
jgi:NAD(P)-dependent dehydrogenase (short-subunit alcohol dehydrogenase family)